MNAQLGPIALHLSRSVCWIRVFGIGVKVADRVALPPLFSDRIHEIRIGRIGIRFLGPVQ